MSSTAAAVKSDKEWMAAQSAAELHDAALHLDFEKQLGHAFSGESDGKWLRRLTELHHRSHSAATAAEEAIEYAQLFATLFERVRQSRGRIASRWQPLVFFGNKRTTGSMTTQLVQACGRAVALAGGGTGAEWSAEVLGLALFAGVEAGDAYKHELQKALEHASKSDDLQLHAARYALELKDAGTAVQHLIRNERYYGHWGRAAGLCQLFGKQFPTTGLTDWMQGIVKDNAEVHKQDVVAFSTLDQALELITTTARCVVPFPGMPRGKHPVRDGVYVPA